MIDPSNVNELAEIGTNALKGNVRYPSEIGGWQLGDPYWGINDPRFSDRNSEG